MVVVFDTDVLIPIILGRKSYSARLFRRLKAAGHKIAVSPQILAEVRTTMLTDQRLRDWLEVSDNEIERFVDRLAKTCSVSLGSRHAHGSVPADRKDEKIIAAALESKASYIVSEDKHLRDLKEYEDIKIMNRQQFEAELDRLGVLE